MSTANHRPLRVAQVRSSEANVVCAIVTVDLSDTALRKQGDGL